MKKTFRNIVVAVAAMTLLVPMGADAHVRTNVNTKVVLRVSDKNVSAGTKVSFAGQVKSPWVKCVKNRKVMIFRNGHKIGARKTNVVGQVVFRRQLFNSANFKLKVPKRVWGVHPHRHSCKKAVSQTIRVNVN